MEKLLKRLTLLLVTATCLTFTACGDDKEEPDGPTPQPSSTEYSIHYATFPLSNSTPNGLLFIPSYRNDEITFCYIGINERLELRITYDKYTAQNIRLANYGAVSSLQQINNLKDLSWIPKGSSVTVSVEEKCGYVIEGTTNGRVYYLRLFIDSFNRNASGDPIGVNVQSQQFIPSGL